MPKRPRNCECDNTHEQNKTCCMPCWNKGFRSVPNPVKVSKDPNKNWRNNGIQFPRLIAEMEAQGVFALPGVLDSLSEEMDLTVDQICGLISRAQTEWDQIKEQTRKVRTILD